MWIVIPAFNEERTIRIVAQTALALCPRVMIIDDGSTDRTVAELEGLPITLLTHSANRGKAASLRSAFEHSLREGAQCVVALDGRIHAHRHPHHGAPDAHCHPHRHHHCHG